MQSDKSSPSMLKIFFTIPRPNSSLSLTATE